MKVFLFALAVISGAVATPQTLAQGRFVEGIIQNAIRDLSNNIREAGLDPLDIQKETFEYRLPVTDLLNVEAFVLNVLVEGLSNIRINNINFSLLAQRVRFDIELPLISAQLGAAGAEVIFANREGTAAASGSLAISRIRVTGEVRANVGIISGISIRSLVIDFTVADITSNLNIEILNRDFSGFVNKALNEKVPKFLRDNRRDINALLVHYLRDIIEEAINN